MDEQIQTEEIWVNVTEGAAITGYHPDYVRKLARDNLRLPEEERLIKTLRRSSGYEMWLPDLINYLIEPKRGPQPKRK